MQIAYAPGPIAFAVCFSLLVTKAEAGYNHPTYMPTLACSKQLGMRSSSPHSMSAPTVDSSHWEAICNEYTYVSEPPLGLPPQKDIEHEINLLDQNAPI